MSTTTSTTLSVETMSELINNSRVTLGYDDIETLTMYKVSVVVNGVLHTLNIKDEDDNPKTMRPQYFYNYVKNNLIKKENGVVTLKTLSVWFVKYFNKHFAHQLNEVVQNENVHDISDIEFPDDNENDEK